MLFTHALHSRFHLCPGRHRNTWKLQVRRSFSENSAHHRAAS
ncbi:hypothetical protein E2C01_055816 [Portunus trituberculatus]|uniref:Uncharacterized protein n=1 Tax=Portunus trituberculatus TaxID=210409 RepID=A0A5B7GNS0_PORTR|nr:hypothetical protein [Portunus trituberculatus]